MPEIKKDFLLLAVHTDKEITHWLQSHAESGWWLRENKGNTFVFAKRPFAGERVCSYTVNSPAFGVSAEDTFYDYLDDLRKGGWDLLAMGMPENLTDRTRHAFLYENPRGDMPHPEIPLSDPDGQRALLRGALKKAISTIVLCLIYTAVFIYFLLSRPVLLLTDIPGTIFLTAMAILIPLCMFFSIRAASLYAKAVRDPEGYSTVRDYYCLDRAVRLSSVMLGILALYLILDLLI